MKPPALDRYLLLAWLHVHAKTSRPVVSAIYTGLTERVERGDFDVQEEPRKGGGITPLALHSVAQIKTDPGSVGALTPGPKQTPLTSEGGAV